MNQEDQGQECNQNQQPEDQDQCNTADTAPASMEERCFIWATTENDNKYDTIFQLRGLNTLEAMRYNFMTMAPKTCIDMVMVSVVCHVLNREHVQMFQRDVYCVPPEILLRPVNVPRQPNPTDCGVYVMKWMEYLDAATLSGAYTFNVRCMVEEWDQLDEFREKIVSEVLLSEHNTLNFEAMNQSKIVTREAITEGGTKL
ncbi:hypothetical protein PIB30_038794 [Stylosanthes scabra]|uniref:Ubiquitin-like protease family profile domain-containing protein n=1 Tax=Stylosanthes scabra TaxID=79078 RepID=A0ABU6ZCS8_9FABA|nr:hypothetical protein [Stylosanthes scabra]